jgi:DNA-binding beta-propeller fold protein YncE
VYVLTSDRAVGGAVHAVDLTTMRVTDTVTVGGAPTQIVTGPDETRAYVVDYDRVAVVCTLSMDVVDSLKVDGRPSCVAQGADSSRLYIADYTGGVSVFSVESSIDALYSQFLATDPVALSASRAPRALHVPRVRQPVSA